MTVFRADSRFAISAADRVFLVCGACVGFFLLLNLSHSVVLSLVIGVPGGIVGNCMALILAKLIWPDGIDQLDLFRLSRGRRYWTAAVIGLVVFWSCYQVAMNGKSFDLFVLVLFYSEFAILFGYFWFRRRRAGPIRNGSRITLGFSTCR